VSLGALPSNFFENRIRSMFMMVKFLTISLIGLKMNVYAMDFDINESTDNLVTKFETVLKRSLDDEETYKKLRKILDSPEKEIFLTLCSNVQCPSFDSQDEDLDYGIRKLLVKMKGPKKQNN
jgi:hypothetical protein